jgi:hypothetical protein
MSDRYPGYDVLNKRRTPSWNEQTRRVIDRRLAMPRDPHFFEAAEWLTLEAVCARIMPQPRTRAPVPLAATIDVKLHERQGDGYRDHRLPEMGAAWRRGLRALEAEARQRYGVAFPALSADEQDGLLRAAQDGALKHAAWQEMECSLFFAKRLLPDITAAYYGHPTAWSEIGFGGPASPRGYVRMGFDRSDPWEAAEAKPGHEAEATRRNARVG